MINLSGVYHELRFSKKKYASFQTLQKSELLVFQLYLPIPLFESLTPPLIADKYKPRVASNKRRAHVDACLHTLFVFHCSRVITSSPTCDIHAHIFRKTEKRDIVYATHEARLLPNISIVQACRSFALYAATQRVRLFEFSKRIKTDRTGISNAR